MVVLPEFLQGAHCLTGRIAGPERAVLEPQLIGIDVAP